MNRHRSTGIMTTKAAATIKASLYVLPAEGWLDFEVVVVHYVE